MKNDLKGIRDYLKWVDKVKREGGYKGPTLEGFLLQHGRDYPVKDFSYQRGIAKACYTNATLEVTRNPMITYVEGYMLLHGVPLAHAWVSWPDGKGTDVTLDNNEGITEYFGVAFKTKFLLEEVLNNGLPGVLSGQDNPRAIERLLTRPPETIVAELALTDA